MVWPTMSGMMVERRDQVLMTVFWPFSLRTSTFLRRWSSTKGPFFRLRGISDLPRSPARAARAATPDDQLLGRLVLVAGSAFGLAPRRYRVATAGGLALDTTVGVVDGVHGHAAGLGADALP